MSKGKRGQRDFIQKRPGLPYYYARIQYAKKTFPKLLAELQKALGDVIDPATGKKRVLKRERWINLGTTDYAMARQLARPYIDEYLDILAFFEGAIAGRPDIAVLKFREYEPGIHPIQGGGRIEATEETFKFFPPNSTRAIEQPNPVTKFKFVPILDEDFVDEHGLSPTPLKDRPALKRAMQAKDEAENLAANTTEDHFFELWRKNSQMKQKDRNAVVTMRREFTEFVEGRAIVDCKRADVVNFINASREALVSDGTIARKVHKLCAFVNWTNLNHDEDTPFVKNIFEKHRFDTKELSRPPFDEGDIKLIRLNKREFNDQQLLLTAIVGTMGVRPAGAAAVRHCSIESYPIWNDKGVAVEMKYTRCLNFPRDKTTSGKVNHGHRTLPIPDQLLNLTNADGVRIFPNEVTGPLFPPPGDQTQDDYIADLLESINAIFKNKLKINTPDRKDPITKRTIAKGKTFYSLRHRAKDVLENVAGPKIALAAMGHSRGTVHSRYGHGVPLHEMKEGMDKVPFFE